MRLDGAAVDRATRQAVTGFLLSLLAVLCGGFGARDQLLLAAMTARQGARPALLVVALVSALVTTGVAAAASGLIAQQLGSNARLVFAALALALAGAELLFARRPRVPGEPTHSLGAFALVMVAHQLTDAVRFLVLAIAVAVRSPLAVGLGGAVGAAALVVGAWLGGEALLARDLTRPRRWIGMVVIALAGVLALRGMGRL